MRTDCGVGKSFMNEMNTLRHHMHEVLKHIKFQAIPLKVDIYFVS